MHTSFIRGPPPHSVALLPDGGVELVWELGELVPGGSVDVACDLVPLLPGESVLSSTWSYLRVFDTQSARYTAGLDLVHRAV